MPVFQRNSATADWPHPPGSVGARPRSWSAFASALVCVAGVVTTLAGGGCSSDSANQETPPLNLGMTSTIPAYYSDENLTMYEVQTPVPLPVRKPTSAETSGAPPAGTPYTHAPYLLSSDESVEVHYTISNLDNQDNSVWLLIDPWNEFVRWDPGVTVVDEDVTEPNFGYDLAFVVPAMSRVQGTITSDDFVEIATKLASVQNMLASPQAMQAEAADASTDDDSNMIDPTEIANHIFNPQNRSNEPDPNYTPWIPSVIAGVTGFDLGLRLYDAAANVAVEITIDIVDMNGNRFVAVGSNQPEIGKPPMTLSPPSARLP